MPAYIRRPLSSLLAADPDTLVRQLHQRYRDDGFSSQYTQQTTAWAKGIPHLQRELARLRDLKPEAADWSVLLEYPLYRLRRRIDLVILSEHVIVVVELKV